MKERLPPAVHITIDSRRENGAAKRDTTTFRAIESGAAPLLRGLVEPRLNRILHPLRQALLRSRGTVRHRDGRRSGCLRDVYRRRRLARALAGIADNVSEQRKVAP